MGMELGDSLILRVRVNLGFEFNPYPCFFTSFRSFMAASLWILGLPGRMGKAVREGFEGLKRFPSSIFFIAPIIAVDSDIPPGAFVRFAG
jgi:hypothetical protein